MCVITAVRFSMVDAAEPSVLQAELTCPVCLDLFNDPHLLACGHNLCLACAHDLRRHAGRGRYCCPECRESLRCSSPLQKNHRLANIAEDYRRRSHPQAPPTAPPPVNCDLCFPDDAAAAVKTCLQCEVSMCSEHVQPHLDRPAFREHPLTEPRGNIRNRKCPAHDEMYRYYCRDEDMFVCNACTIEGRHAGHTIHTLKNTVRDLKESLEEQGQKLSRKISRIEKFLRQHGEAEDFHERFVEEAEQHLRVVGEQMEELLREFLSALHECLLTRSRAGPEEALQLSYDRIREDGGSLRLAQSYLQALLQENDPFKFLQEYTSTRKRLHKALRMQPFSPGSVRLDTEALAEVMEAKLQEFQTEFRLQITDLIYAVCAQNSGEEEEEAGEEEEEVVEEGEEEDDSESDEEEDGVHDVEADEGAEDDDQSGSAGDVYDPEEEEGEEEVSSD
ncbi:hypothetical protein GJAV_G00155880 [Gymnothorax javanicus]|nr:hypothetical protein GJAV_G00155880 [Gymnothorax javanicus]